MKDDRYTRITLRIPKDLHEALVDAADGACHSMNAEIIARLEASFAAGESGNSDQQDIEERLAAMIAEKLRGDFRRLEEEIRKHPASLSKAAVGAPFKKTAKEKA